MVQWLRFQILKARGPGSSSSQGTRLHMPQLSLCAATKTQCSQIIYVSDSLQPHESQHARLTCPSPTPRACSNSCPFESVMPSNQLILFCPFLLLPSIFPASGSFQRSQLFTPGGESIGVSASASVLPMYIQDWFPLIDWLEDSQESSPTPQFKSINSLALSFLYSPTLTSAHDYWKNHSFD